MSRHIASTLILVSIFAAHASDDGGSTDTLTVPEPVHGVMSKYCISCHGEKKSKGQVRLDTLSKADMKVRLDVLNKLQEQLHFREMPPEDEKQPAPAVQKLLADWVRGELLKLQEKWFGFGMTVSDTIPSFT